MKKFVGPICSGVASIFTFIILSLNWLTTTTSMSTGKGAVSGWELISDAENVNGNTIYKLSAILLIILAVLLIANMVLIILKNSKVIKANFNFNKLNVILLTIFAILTFLMLIGSFVMANDLSYTQTLISTTVEIKTSVSFGAWFMLIIGWASCLFNWIAYKKDKNEIKENEIKENEIKENEIEK